MDLQIFRNNLRMKLQEKKLTLNALSMRSDLSEDTLRSIIYGKSQDIKLSTLVKIADVLQCTLDELIDRSTYSPTEQKIIKQIHQLSDRSFRTIEYVVTLEEKYMLMKSSKGLEYIPIFTPVGNLQDGMYYDANIIDNLDITDYPSALKKIIDFGIRIQTENYEPIYHPNDILLFSKKNNPRYHDIVAYVNINGQIYIRKYTELGLIPINGYGEIIPTKNLDQYTPLGVVVKTVTEFDIEQYR